MKIRLDEREIVAIVEEWARTVHKSKDVSSMFQLDITPEVIGKRNKLEKKATINQIYIDLDVMIKDSNYGGLDQSNTHEAVVRARQAIAAGVSPESFNGPELSGPPLDTSAVPI